MFRTIPAEALADLPAIREEARSFLAEQNIEPSPDGWDRFDPEFSRKLGAKGWIGMTWPRRYAGHERSSLERYVITEELLTAGAPVRAHWAADRQIGPLLLSAGTEEQKEMFLPRIAAGECYFCIGMSEPNSGSDFASIRTRAVRCDGGYVVSGTKVWSGQAHLAHYMNLFARTSPFDRENRRAGISQFIVDMTSPGLTVNPIHNLAGAHEFNEVVFDEVFVPENLRIGQEGDGWQQVSGELAYERSSSERWLASFGVLSRLVDELDGDIPTGDAEKLGRAVARVWTLHRMALSIATTAPTNPNLANEAGLVKDLGTELDQLIPELAAQIMPPSRRSLSDNNEFEEVLRRGVLYAPSFSIRGGAREIIRGVIAGGIGAK